MNHSDFGCVADLVNLQVLNLAYNVISDAGMVHLKGMSAIKLHIPIEAWYTCLGTLFDLWDQETGLVLRVIERFETAQSSLRFPE